MNSYWDIHITISNEMLRKFIAEVEHAAGFIGHFGEKSDPAYIADQARRCGKRLELLIAEMRTHCPRRPNKGEVPA